MVSATLAPSVPVVSINDAPVAVSPTDTTTTATSPTPINGAPKKTITKPKPLGRVPPSPLRASSTFGSLLSPLPNVNAFNPLSPRLGAGAGLSPKPGAGFGGLLSPRPGVSGFNGMPVSPRIWGPEGSEGFDQWFEHFEQFDATLQEMVTAANEPKFKEELETIEHWFEVLSEAERTATVYTLLQHSNPTQVRFLIAVLQQMLKSDQVRPQPSPDPTKPKVLNSSGRPPLSVPTTPRTPNHPNGASHDQTKDIKTSLAPGIIVDKPAGAAGGQDVEVPSKPKADWASMVNTPLVPMFKPQQNQKPKQPQTPNNNLGMGMYSPMAMGMMSPFQMQMQMGMGMASPAAMMGLASPGMMNMNDAQVIAMQMMINGMATQQMLGNMHAQAQFPTSPNPNSPLPGGKGSQGTNGANVGAANGRRPSASSSWRASTGVQGGAKFSGTAKMANGRRLSGASSTTKAGSTTGGSTTGGNGGSDFNPDMLKDIPAWLKSLRLHKYTPCFEGLGWKEIVVLEEGDLEKRGVAALGARRRLLKTFETVRKEMGMEDASIPSIELTPVAEAGSVAA
ncbi:hypothetical protein BDN72DRAFT_788696 [Pluteus cervinus]|uniref:Uncharacterized protein n=1 Tax=Pluteus cervinus TaxID=181527 RepID=A0ACD3B8V7_9AGAR|nr:hypothetical protein BDN72DRAFT_788696 [Pluteus cervinus]